MVCGFDCQPSDCLALISIEYEVGRELRDEPVEMVVASGRAESSPRVKLRVTLATVMVIVGSSARARPDSSKKQSGTRARMTSPLTH